MEVASKREQLIFATKAGVLAFSVMAVMMMIVLPTSLHSDRLFIDQGDAINHIGSFAEYVTHPPAPEGPGINNRVLYPIGVSTVFLDAFPAFSWSMRTFLPHWLIPANPEALITYHMTLAFWLIAGFAAALCSLLSYPKRSYLCSLIAGLIAGWWPVHAGRTQGHLALSLMYVEVAALVFLLVWLWSERKSWGSLIGFTIFTAWAAGTHPYHAYMILMVAGLALAWDTVLRIGRLPIGKRVVQHGIFIGVAATMVLLVWYAFGAFPPPHISGQRGGIHDYVSKPIAFLLGNHSIMFLLFPRWARRVRNLSWEGEAFIGSILCILALTFIFRTLYKIFWKKQTDAHTLALGAMIGATYMVFITSWGMVYFRYGESIWSWISPLKWVLTIDPNFSMFRALGRLAWPFSFFAIAAGSAWLAWRKLPTQIVVGSLILATSYYEFYYVRAIYIETAMPFTFLAPDRIPAQVKELADKVLPMRDRVEAIGFYPAIVGQGQLEACAAQEDAQGLKSHFQFAKLLNLPISSGWAAILSDDACQKWGDIWKRPTLAATLSNDGANIPYHILIVSRARVHPKELDPITEQFRHKLLAENGHFQIYGVKLR